MSRPGGNGKPESGAGFGRIVVGVRGWEEGEGSLREGGVGCEPLGGDDRAAGRSAVGWALFTSVGRVRGTGGRLSGRVPAGREESMGRWFDPGPGSDWMLRGVGGASFGHCPSLRGRGVDESARGKAGGANLGTASGGWRRGERKGKARRKSPRGGSRMRTAGGRRSRCPETGGGWVLFSRARRVRGTRGRLSGRVPVGREESMGRWFDPGSGSHRMLRGVGVASTGNFPFSRGSARASRSGGNGKQPNLAPASGGLSSGREKGKAGRKSPRGGSQIRTAGGRRSRYRAVSGVWALFSGAGRVRDGKAIPNHPAFSFT